MCIADYTQSCLDGIEVEVIKKGDKCTIIDAREGYYVLQIAPKYFISIRNIVADEYFAPANKVAKVLYEE